MRSLSAEALAKAGNPSQGTIVRRSPVVDYGQLLVLWDEKFIRRSFSEGWKSLPGYQVIFNFHL